MPPSYCHKFIKY